MGVHTVRLRIGVIDIPYDYGEEPDKTTFQVAKKLQQDYHLFSAFYRRYQRQILTEVRDDLVRNFSDMIKYSAPAITNFQLSKTSRVFDLFLTLRIAEQKGYGMKGRVPTWAAEHGVNSRLKQKKGPRRPSFIDGGLLKASVRIWVDTDA